MAVIVVIQELLFIVQGQQMQENGMQEIQRMQGHALTVTLIDTSTKALAQHLLLSLICRPLFTQAIRRIWSVMSKL